MTILSMTITIFVAAVTGFFLVRIIRKQEANKRQRLLLEITDLQHNLTKAQNVISHQDEVAINDVEMLLKMQLKMQSQIVTLLRQRDDALMNVEMLLSHYEKGTQWNLI